MFTCISGRCCFVFCWTPFCCTPWDRLLAGLPSILVNFNMCLNSHTQSAGGGCPGSLWLAAEAVPRVSSFFCHLTTFRYVVHPLQRGWLLESCLLSWQCAVNVNDLRAALAGPGGCGAMWAVCALPLWEHTCPWAPCLRHPEKCLCINKTQGRCSVRSKWLLFGPNKWVDCPRKCVLVGP